MCLLRTDRWQTLDGEARTQILGCEQYIGPVWYDGSEPIPRRKSVEDRASPRIVHTFYGLQHDRRIQTVQRGDLLEKAMLEHRAMVREATK